MDNNSFSLNPRGEVPPPLPPRDDEAVKVTPSKTIGITSEPPIQNVITDLGKVALFTSENKTTFSSERNSFIKVQSLSNTGSKAGVWQSIVHYFNRHFGKITPEEKEKAESIQTLIQTINERLEKTNQYTERAENAEKRNKNLFPSEETVKPIDLYIEKVTLELKQASSNLNSLVMKRESADQLAKDRATYDSLPLEIESLVKKVAYSDAHLTVAQKLRDLEVTLKDYKSYGPDKTFENFHTILTKKEVLEATLKDILSTPIFENDKVLQNYRQKPEWTTADLHQLIQRTFPSFTGQIRRLSDSAFKVRDKRMENLNKNLLHLSYLSSIYNSQAYRIDNLERKLNSPSIIYRIYRLFHGPAKLSVQLKSANDQLLATYQDMLKYEKKLDPAEVNYVKGLNKSSPHFKLKNSIDSIQQVIANTTSREEIAGQLSQLTHQFNQLNPLIQTSPVESLELNKLKLAIKENMNRLATDMAHISQEIDPKKISSRLMILTALEQLQTLLPLAFPDLQFRTDSLFESIKKNNLVSDLETGINETLSPYIDAHNMPAKINAKAFSLILLQKYAKDKDAQTATETPVEIQEETTIEEKEPVSTPVFNRSDLSDPVKTLTSSSEIDKQQMTQEEQYSDHLPPPILQEQFELPPPILEEQSELPPPILEEQSELSPSPTGVNSNSNLSKIPSPPTTLKSMMNNFVNIAKSSLPNFQQAEAIIQSANEVFNPPSPPPLVEQKKGNPSLTSRVSLLDQISGGPRLKKVGEKELLEKPQIEDNSILGILLRSTRFKRVGEVNRKEDDESDNEFDDESNDEFKVQK